MTSNNRIDKKLDKELEIYNTVLPQYSRSKQDVWNEIESQIEETSSDVSWTVPMRSLVLRYALAAMIIAILGIGLVMRFYSVSIETNRGMHSEVVLPDGSNVNLNAMSSLNYHPWWWRFQRKVQLNGEAFFNVTKGESFTVVSNKVNTMVLGTSFNVYSRESVTQVSCVTGSVRVNTHEGEIVLKPMEQAVLNANNRFYSEKFEDVKTVNAWIDSEFHYSSTAFSRVMEDIQLQYNVEINAEPGIDLTLLKYSGNYKKNHSVENVLNLVCKPFDLDYKEISKGKYHLFYDK